MIEIPLKYLNDKNTLKGSKMTEKTLNYKMTKITLKPL